MEAISIKQVYDNEISRSDLVSPEHSLRVALARTGKRNYAKIIFFTWPNLETASRKLAAAVSHHYPTADGEGFLLDKALMAACDEFENSVETENFTRRMAKYLNAMLKVAADEIMNWDTHGILVNGDSVVWQLGDLSMYEWVKRKSVNRIVFTKRQKSPGADECEAAQTALSSSVVTYNDLVHMKRAKS
jgi:hypothetical protein